MMENPLVELRIDFLTRGTQLRTACILFMREKNGERRIPFLVSEDEMVALQNAVMKQSYATTDLAARLAGAYGMETAGVVLYIRADHTYAGLIRMEHPELGMQCLECGVGTAVCMALRTGAPIFMPQAILELRCSPPAPDGQVAFSIGAMTDELLQEALQVAVENDEFETAALLQREIDLRKSGKE